MARPCSRGFCSVYVSAHGHCTNGCQSGAASLWVYCMNCTLAAQGHSLYTLERGCNAMWTQFCVGWSRTVHMCCAASLASIPCFASGSGLFVVSVPSVPAGFVRLWAGVSWDCRAFVPPHTRRECICSTQQRITWGPRVSALCSLRAWRPLRLGPAGTSLFVSCKCYLARWLH